MLTLGPIAHNFLAEPLPFVWQVCAFRAADLRVRDDLPIHQYLLWWHLLRAGSGERVSGNLRWQAQASAYLLSLAAGHCGCSDCCCCCQWS